MISVCPKSDTQLFNRLITSSSVWESRFPVGSSAKIIAGLVTNAQGLQELYDKYKDQGFEILDFPCNQFMGQAPGSAEEINTFCTLNYHTTFPRFAKIKVNGKEAEPLFDWLKKEKSGPLGARIEWNFAKFLINRDGQVVERFSSKTDPLKMEEAIKSLINN